MQLTELIGARDFYCSRYLNGDEVKTVIILSSLFVILSSVSFATETSTQTCDTKLSCNIDQKEFTLLFESPSKDCTEDDMSISIARDDKKTKLELPKNWLEPLSDVGPLKSACGLKDNSNNNAMETSAPVFTVSPGVVLMFYSESGRPSYDYVSIALIDIKNAKVLDSRPRFAKDKEAGVAVLKTKKGFKLRLVGEYLKEVKCDCGEAFIEKWVEVWVEKDKIKTRWF